MTIMKMLLPLAAGAAALALGSGTSYAGGSEGSIGVGAEEQLNGIVDGVSVNYDMGAFHLGGVLGIIDPAGADNTDILLGGRFYYHVHSTAMTDFSIGGSVGVAFIGAPGDADTTEVFLEPGLQIRAFVASNVALSFGAGLTLGLADASGVAITGDLTGTAGVHYYFF